MVEYPESMDRAPREPGPDEVRYVHTASVYLRAAMWTGALIAVLLLGLTAWDTALIRHGQVQNHSTLTNTATAAQAAQTTAEAIHSCVTPGQPCYQRAQRRTGAVISDVKEIIIAAAACSSGLAPDLPTAAKVSAIQTCVIDRLAADSPKGSP